MGPKDNQRRYRVNPLELMIFCLVCAGFGFSVYSLFRETADYQFAALQPMSSEPTRAVRHTASNAERMPASVAEPIQMEIPCSENPELKDCAQNPGRVIHLSPRHNPAENR